MLSKFTALLLAIVVANPFCCCLAAALEGAVPANSPDEHACCMLALTADEAPADRPTGGGDKSCECEDGSREPFVAQKSIDPMGDTQWKLLAALVWDLPSDEIFSGAPEDCSRVCSRSPHRSPGKRLSQVHCVYRL